MFQKFKMLAKQTAFVTGGVLRDTANFVLPGLAIGGTVLVLQAPVVLGVILISATTLMTIVIALLMMGMAFAILKYAIERDLAKKIFGIQHAS